jgi:hypothetical protein
MTTPTIGPASEPSINDLSPLIAKGVEREPMLLLDITGSMSYPASDSGTVSRRDVVHEAIKTFVTVLGAADSQAAKEKAAGEDAGGVMTITFADGKATNIEDLSPDNVTEKWAKIPWGGSTVIMPGWELLVETYMEEFGNVAKQDRPHMLATVITDGEAEDTDTFAQTLSQTGAGTYVLVAIVGFGAEHDSALKSYKAIADANPHVRVLSFDSVTDPNKIANELLAIAQ